MCSRTDGLEGRTVVMEKKKKKKGKGGWVLLMENSCRRKLIMKILVGEAEMH